MANAPWKELRHDAATPARLIPALSSGFVVGLLLIVIQLSLASLIFAGPLGRFAPNAVGITLFGSALMCLFVALYSGFPASVCAAQDAPAAVMAAVAAGVAASLAPGGQLDCAPVTVVAAMTLATLATGLLFLAMGRFGLGNLMRYVPYPVVGGFMAGIGWLLVQGGVSIVAGASLSLHDLPMLLTEDRLLRLLPAVLLTLGLLFALTRWSSVFILPGALATAVAAFVLYMAATGRGLTDAKLAGFLLGGMPDGGALWPAFNPADLERIRWSALVPQIPQLCTIPLVSVISLLLTTSGVETATKRDLDLGRELSVNGMANLLGAFAGCQAGYTALSLSMLGPKTGTDSRLSGVFAALLLGTAAFFGAGVLGYFPRFILGGMVLFLGVDTLLDWVVDARRRVSRLDYALILAILCAIALFGFLTGVAFGIVAAALIFVIKYSRLPVLRQNADATELSSTRQRSVPDQHILRRQGQDIRVLRVTGYLFFGSANLLSRSVASCLQPEQGSAPDHLILDFAEVTGFDSSAVNSFLRMLQRCAAANCQLVFAAPPPRLEEQMRRAAPQETDGARFLPDLDRALEWCEDAVLAREQARVEAHGQAEARDRLFDLAVDDLLQKLEDAERFEALLERLAPQLEPRSVKQGEVILQQGQIPDGVWLLISGQAEELCQGEAGAVSRLRSLGPGCMAGHAAPERGSPAPGSITALSDCALSFLPAATLNQLEATDPEAALAFYSLFTAQLEARLAQGLGKAGQ